MKPKLTLTFDAGMGRGTYSMCLDLDEMTARDIEKISPPMPVPGAVSFDAVVEVLRVREFRKDLFLDASHNLGALLAERMQDAEGWADASRIEPAKRELRA